MPKTKEQKKEMLKALEKKLADAKSVVFTKFERLTVSENNELRQKLKAEDGEFLVAKKTLLGKALKGKKQDDVKLDEFDGQIAAIFGYGDEAVPAKITDEFMREHEEKLEFLGGILEDKYIDPAQVAALAKLPGKLELQAKLVGTLNAPISGFVNIMAGNIRSLANVLNAIKDAKS